MNNIIYTGEESFTQVEPTWYAVRDDQGLIDLCNHLSNNCPELCTIFECTLSDTPSLGVDIDDEYIKNYVCGWYDYARYAFFIDNYFKKETNANDYYIERSRYDDESDDYVPWAPDLEIIVWKSIEERTIFLLKYSNHQDITNYYTQHKEW